MPFGSRVAARTIRCERWVSSVRRECLDWLLVVGRRHSPLTGGCRPRAAQRPSAPKTVWPSIAGLPAAGSRGLTRWLVDLGVIEAATRDCVLGKDACHPPVPNYVSATGDIRDEGMAGHRRTALRSWPSERCSMPDRVATMRCARRAERRWWTATRRASGPSLSHSPAVPWHALTRPTLRAREGAWGAHRHGADQFRIRRAAVHGGGPSGPPVDVLRNARGRRSRGMGRDLNRPGLVGHHWSPLPRRDCRGTGLRSADRRLRRLCPAGLSSGRGDRVADHQRDADQVVARPELRPG